MPPRTRGRGEHRLALYSSSSLWHILIALLYLGFVKCPGGSTTILNLRGTTQDTLQTEPYPHLGINRRRRGDSGQTTKEHVTGLLWSVAERSA